MAKGKAGKGETRRDELVRENERLRQVVKGLQSTRRYTVGAAIAKEAVKYGLSGLFIWLSVKALAGKVTVVDAAVDMCTSLVDSLKELVPSWIVQIVTVIVLFTSLLLVKRVRATNKQLIKRAANATSKYESLIDPERTSSRLGNDGDANKGDGL